MRNISEISESLWGKTLMRDIDGSERKEDDIDGFDAEEMWNYILDKYEFIDVVPPEATKDHFEMPLIYDGVKGRTYSLFVTYWEGNIDIISLQAVDYDKYDWLKKDYRVAIFNSWESALRDKEGNVSNKMVVDIIEKFIANVAKNDRVLLKKK